MKPITQKPTVAFATHGCRFNQSETEQMVRSVLDREYRVVSFEEKADVYVVNTCAVTEKSEGKCRRTFHRIRREYPSAKLVVAGCCAESNCGETNLRGEANPYGDANSCQGANPCRDANPCQGANPFPEADLILGNSEKLSLGDYLRSESESGWTRETGLPKAFVGGVATHSRRELAEAEWGREPAPGPARPNGRTNVYVKIQNGCDELCTFCIIKSTRGKSRSRSEKSVLTEIRGHVDGGYREVVLTGINLGQYGIDGPEPKQSLSDLLIQIAELPGDFRIRLSSINPNEVTPDLIRTIRDNRKFCRHLHIPLQSGSDPVLLRMKRGYLSGYYRDLILRVAEEIPGVGIGTDVLVGFPGEGEREFQDTVDLLESLPLNHFHVFPYSERKGTEAFSFPDSVSVPVRKERVRILKSLGEAKAGAFRRRFIGLELELLVETARDESGSLKGFSDNYIPCSFSGPDRLKGTLIRAVGIEDAPDRLMCGTPTPNRIFST